MRFAWRVMKLTALRSACTVRPVLMHLNNTHGRNSMCKTTKTIVGVTLSDNQVRLYKYDSDEFNESSATISKSAMAEQQQQFDTILTELASLISNDDLRDSHAGDFIARHGVFLHNLARTGFAIDVAQYVKSD